MNKDNCFKITNNSGFTVIEVVVATAILSLVFAGLSIILIQQQRQFNLTSQGVEVDQTGRTAIDFLATEIRNAGSRQGKNIALRFFNGGSEFDPRCSDNTTKTDEESPPDCLQIYTWDITEGQTITSLGVEFPSVSTNILVSLVSNEMHLEVDQWVDESIIESGGLIGFWSRGSLCNPEDTTIDKSGCLSEPAKCTECAAILKIEDLDTSNKIAKAKTLDGGLIEQNFQTTDFSDPGLTDFFTNFFLPRISSLSSEMTVIESSLFTIDQDKKSLLLRSAVGGNFISIAGGENENDDQIGPGIVDLQFVFNLQDSDGGTTKVGVADDASLRHFKDFTVVNSLDGFGREKDVRVVEIYLVVRSRLKPQLISGGRIPTKQLSQIGDVKKKVYYSFLAGGGIYL